MVNGVYWKCHSSVTHIDIRDNIQLTNLW